MTSQNLVNTRQSSVNKRQTAINESQGVINQDQNAINEMTTIKLSVKSFWGLMILIISVTSFYLYNNFAMATDIREIKQNVAYIKNGLESHLEDSVQARKDMKVTSDKRDANFANIFERLARAGL
jgi:hypothetical protein